MKKRVLTAVLTLVMVFSLFPAPAAAVDGETIAGVTPLGTTINLFDYWVNENDHNDLAPLNGADTSAANQGINEHSPLKFASSGPGYSGNINIWTGYDGGITKGIVKSLLGEDNYPVLAANLDTGLSSGVTEGTESLGYLFSSEAVKGKEIYTDTHGLFQVDDEGYFSFDSSETLAQLDTTTKSFILTGYGDGAQKGFFPFDTVDTQEGAYRDRNGNVANNLNSADINHFLGANMTTQFVQSENGMTSETSPKPVTYEFVGDDDVWIFIDGVLVGDVGGIHNASTVMIDFSTGEVTYKTSDTSGNFAGVSDMDSTLFEQYIQAVGADNVKYFTKTTNDDGTVTKVPADADRADNAEITVGVSTHEFKKTAAGNWIFADKSYHTLDFFYLERGAGQSNMNLRFNLEEIPPTYIRKVDQNGEGIGGVKFDLYVVKPVSEDVTRWKVGDAVSDDKVRVATGITSNDPGNKGDLTLRYSDDMGYKAGKVVSLPDLYNSYSDLCVDTVVTSGDLEYADSLLLELDESEETAGVLKGYRHAGTSSLRLENINGSYILRSNERWNSGVYATPSVQIAAPKNVTLMNSATRDLSQTEDKVGMFAVIMAWVGENPPTVDTIQNEQNWAPFYGSALDGWHIQMLDFNGIDYAKALGKAIGEYAEKNDGSVEGFVYPFTLDVSGSYNASIESLPGEVEEYYFMLADSNGNIVDAEGNTDEEKLAQVRYTTAFYYSDAASYADMDGNQTYRVDHRGSNFERNFAATVSVPNIQNRLMVQRLDAQGNTVNGAEYGLYSEDQVETVDGELRLKEGATPLATDTTRDRSTAQGDHLTANGIAAFHDDLDNGVYYVIETQAPEGYAHNDSVVKVIVDDNGVYAYAGEANGNVDPNKGISFGDGDGISVLNGTGNLVATMAYFGSLGDVNTTLTDIYVLRAAGTEENNVLSWKQIDIGDTPYLQRKWRTYSSESAMEYKYAEGTDAIGGENILEGKENPYGYLSSSGWNSTLISQNYYGIYDNGVPYDDLYDTLDEEEQALINYEIRTKIALPHTEYKPDDDQRLDISDGFTSFGNKILNGLFSGTTIIRVAETAAGSLTISKTVEDTAGADDHGAFPFTVGFEFTAPDLNYTDDRPEKMVGDIDLTPELAGTYDYTVSKTGEDDVTGALNIVKDDTGSGYHIDVANEEGRLNESGKLMLSDGESLTIHGLPIGTTYTVTEDDVDGYAQSVTAKSDGTVLAPDGLKVSNKIEAAGQADALSYTNTAEHTKTLSYTVEYYKDNVLVEGDTQTVKKVVNEDSPEDTLDVDKTAINVTDKYEGYKFEKTDPETLPDTVNNGDVIKVYYVTKPTKTLSYTVEYYKDGTLVAADTQTVTETVDEDAADTLTVDKASINTTNKYSGYNFQKTDPAAIPDSINDGGIIKVYYVRDNSGGDDDDDDERDDKTPSKLNTDDHFAYVIGYPDGSVRPEGNITRAEAATIFFRLLKSDVRNDNLTKNSPFDDVTRDMWCNQPIATMAHLGIVQGRSADNFVPSASITRAELAAICARFDESDTKSVSEFSDVSGHWAEEEIGRAAALGWVEGYPDGTFRPDEPITRAEAMTMINRVLKRVPKGESDLRAGMNTWPDNQPGDWYYLAVQEATNSHDFNRVGRVNERWTRLRGDPDWASYER